MRSLGSQPAFSTRRKAQQPSGLRRVHVKVSCSMTHMLQIQHCLWVHATHPPPNHTQQDCACNVTG
jgi:hypothetical protein